MPAVKSILDVDARLADQIVGRGNVIVPNLNHEHIILREAGFDLEYPAGQ